MENDYTRIMPITNVPNVNFLITGSMAMLCLRNSDLRKAISQRAHTGATVLRFGKYK